MQRFAKVGKSMRNSTGYSSDELVKDTLLMTWSATNNGGEMLVPCSIPVISYQTCNQDCFLTKSLVSLVEPGFCFGRVGFI